MDTEFVSRYQLDNLPLQVKLNFIDLYKVEILDRLNQNVEHWKDFRTVLEESIIDAYVKKYNNTFDADDNTKDSVTKAFYSHLEKSDKTLYLYSSLMDFLKKYDTELYKSMCIDEWKDESFATFNKLLIFLHDLRPVFDIEKVYSRLQMYSPELGRLYDPVIQRWKSHEIDKDYAVSLLIRTFCIMIDNATYHLLNAIYLSSKQAEIVVERKFPNFNLFYQKNIFEDRDGIIHVVEPDQDVFTAIQSIMDDSHSPYAKYIFFGEIPPYHLMPLMYQTTADSSLNLRNYQHELSEKALEGENTLICAPTGSGKTIVAINIIRQHIFKFRKEGKRCKIVFVVPSVPLVEQQKVQLEKFLGHFAKVDKIYGGMNTVAIDFEAFVKSVDILVLTPQILVNHINIDYCRLEGKTPLQLDVFTLIVLDEVHHTVKDHPYANLMAEYHRQKYNDSNISIKPMPQVVGLTASIGCPKNPKSPAQIVEHMIETCANFDARSVTRVKKNISELAEFTSKTDDDIQIIKNNDEETKKYHNYISTLSKSIEDYFRNLDGISSLPNVFKDHCDISNLEYLKWLSVAKTITAEAHLPVQSQTDAYSCLDYLRQLYDALLCAQCLPTKDTSEFYFEDLGNQSGTKAILLSQKSS
uniref:Helicase ATP-binding domain-containing protein n=1 Tax=Panagrolaimus sp. ES5 TaxID=591445 RepID=A0AC34F9V1_9BILA